MKWLIPCIFVLAGCWSNPQGGGDPSTPAPTGAAAFYEDMAIWTESGEVATSDEFLKVAGIAAGKLHIQLGPAYDAAFSDLVEAHKELTDADRKELAAKLRQLK